MKKPKSFALFVVLLLLQQSFTLRLSQKPHYPTNSMILAATATNTDDAPEWDKYSTAFSASQSAAEPAIDAFEKIVEGGAASKSITKILGGLKALGAAFGALGLVFALVDIFNPQPDPLDKVMEMMKGMEERILKEIGEKFAFLKNDNLKNLYYGAERHIKDAAKYLNRMSEAKQAKNKDLYALFHLAFMKRVEASGIDDLEAIMSIFSGDTYFVSQPFLENLIDTYHGDSTKIDAALKAITLLVVQGFLNLHTYIALSDQESQGLKNENQPLSEVNQKLSTGLAEYQNESIEKLSVYVKTLESLQKARLQGYLEANLKDFMTKNCKPQTQREQPCADAINKQLDQAFGNLFKFTTFCMNKDVSQNDYKGIDMFYVKDVHNMNCVVFWSSPEDSATKSNLDELKALGDQNFYYKRLEDWDQYVILPKDTTYNQWPGFASTYASFDSYQSDPAKKLVWGRYRKTQPGVCRLTIINALGSGQTEYDRDNVVTYLDESNRILNLETLPGDLNDKVSGLYFYGKGCDTCSVQVFQDAYYKGKNKIFYPEASSNGLTISKTGYGDTFLAGASSLQASCELPTSQCKFVFGEKSPQDQQDSFEFSLSSGQSQKENLYGNGKRSDLNDNVSWLRMIGGCDGCRVDAYPDPNYRGQPQTYKGAGNYTIYQDSFLNTKISSYIAAC